MKSIFRLLICLGLGELAVVAMARTSPWLPGVTALISLGLGWWFAPPKDVVNTRGRRSPAVREASLIRHAGWGLFAGGVAALGVGAFCMTEVGLLQGREFWFDRDRRSLEQQLSAREQSGDWSGAVALIRDRLDQPSSPSWRTTLQHRQFHNELQLAVVGDADRFARLMPLKTASLHFQDRLATELLAGLTAAETVEDLRRAMVEQQRHAAGAHIDSVLAHAADLWRYPDDAYRLLTVASHLDAQSQVPHTSLTDRLQQWSPPASLSSTAEVQLIRAACDGAVGVVELHVQDHEEFLGGLTSRDFMIRDRELPLRHFIVEERHVRDGHLQCAIVLDCSASTVGKPFTAAVAGANRLATTMDATAQLRLWSFANAVSAHSAWTSSATEFTTRTNLLKPDGRTALLQALETVTRDLANQSGSRHLILFSDGKDTIGGPGIEATIQRMREHDITAHVIALQTNDVDLPLLQHLADTTHGALYVVDEAERLSTSFALLAEQLKRPRYRLTILFDQLPRDEVTIFVGRDRQHFAKVSFVSDVGLDQTPGNNDRNPEPPIERTSP